MHGLRLFASSPIWGVGYGIVETADVRVTFGAQDPHNAYIRIMAFYGMLGVGVFAYFFFMLFRALTLRVDAVDPIYAYWRPFFVGSAFAILVVNLFNSYIFDRNLYVAVAFAAALERACLMARSGTPQAPADPTTTPADPLVESPFGASPEPGFPR